MIYILMRLNLLLDMAL